MMSRALATEANRIIALRQILWICDWYGFPRFAAIR